MIVAIDYARMQREFPKQKAALTRAQKKGYDAVLETTRKTVQTWDEIGAWPDDWARWQRAVDDAYNKAFLAYIRDEIDDRPQPAPRISEL